MVSRQIVRYDSRPLVLWSDTTPAASPNRKAESKAGTNEQSQFQTSSAQRFPVEKLAMPRQTPDRPAYIPSTPPPEEDEMDWTPSLKQEIRPRFSVAQENHGGSFTEKSPFYGSLPEAPRPPSWQLRNPAPRRPVEKVVEQNPFHRVPSEQENRAADKGTRRGSDVYFSPPKFFPPSDYSATTGLETLFDKAFTIRSPDDEPSDHVGNSMPPASVNAQKSFVYQCLRLALLVACLIMWHVSQMELVSIPGNYVEIISLGSASLISGFALLEILKKPMSHWNSMEILVSLAELAAAIHLGGNLPRIFYEREYFDRYGKSLLVFMTAQEVVGLGSSYQQARSSAQSSGSNATASEQTQTAHPQSQAGSQVDHSRSGSQTLSSAPGSPPELSFSSTLATSSFSQPSFSNSQSPPQNYSLYRQDFDKDNDNDSDATEGSDTDSDAETTVTSTTNKTIRHMNPFAVDSPRSTRSKGSLGSGLQGLSLEDSPARPMTRSQASQAPGGEAYRRYALRRNR